MMLAINAPLLSTCIASHADNFEINSDAGLPGVEPEMCVIEEHYRGIDARYWILNTMLKN